MKTHRHFRSLIHRIIASLPGCALVSITSLLACSPVKLAARDPADTLREFRQDIISSKSLSPISLQAVRAPGLTQDSILKEGASVEVKKAFERFADKVDRAFIESEVAIGRAQLLEDSHPERAVGLYLFAADVSWQAMFFPECLRPVDLRCDSFKVYYDRATRGALSYLNKLRKAGHTAPPVFDSNAGRRFHVEIAEGPGLESWSEYDSLVASSSISLEGLSSRYRRPGVGVPLTACRARRDDSLQERYLPRVGVCLPLTALLRFPLGGCTAEECTVRLELLNAYNTPLINEGESSVPLSADFTAPFASLVDRTGIGGFDGFFGALSGNEDLLKQTGFYSMEPYNSGKIPLITVHGLFSSPVTWIDVHNDLMGDPVIRERYQVWHYMYPTNLPIVVNARTFREKLDELAAYLQQNNPGKEPGMVIISHSMGGLLTRTAVVTNSEPMKRYLFDNPDKLKKLPEDVQKEYAAYLDFSRKPYIDRVIFVAVPHRGSDIADNWIGALGRYLMTLPVTLVSKTKDLATGARNLLRPELQTDFDSDDRSSIRGLSRKNPALIGLSQCTIDPAVPYHSIIGDRGKGDTPNSSDGVVDYDSSHLEGAQSELIVPAHHSAHTSPRAVYEIRRILRLHIGAPGGEPS